VSVLKACAIVKSLQIGEEIEVEIRKQGLLLERNVVLGTALVDMYCKCGALEKAHQVFRQLSVRNVVTWSALMTGYVEHGLGHEALKCYREMRDARVSLDVVTYLCVLKACGIVGSQKVGEDIDIEIRKQGLLQNEYALGNALVDTYSKCNAMEKAHEVFKLLPMRDVVSWNALITGYVQNGLGREALECVRQMQEVGVRPDMITYVSILKACGIVGSLEIGQDIDAEVRKQGLLHKDVTVGNALVDMYSKCGSLEKAHAVFEQLPVKDVVTWSALISGHAQLGDANISLHLYRRMAEKDILPNSVTFVVLLSACSHAGLLKEGESLFNEMFAVYHFNPRLEHYTCMVDLFGRVGWFDRVEALLSKVSHCDHLPLLLSVLGSCRKWRNVKLAKWAFEHSLMLDENCAAAYVDMENIYAST
jgi:pentatricopeptide repeat protein